MREIQNITDKTYDATQVIAELKCLTSSNSNNQSLKQELNNQETNTDLLQKIINRLTSQNNDQADLISDL